MNYVIVYSGTVLLFWDLSKKSVSQLLFSAVTSLSPPKMRGGQMQPCRLLPDWVSLTYSLWWVGMTKWRRKTGGVGERWGDGVRKYWHKHGKRGQLPGTPTFTKHLKICPVHWKVCLWLEIWGNKLSRLLLSNYNFIVHKWEGWFKLGKSMMVLPDSCVGPVRQATQF